MKKLIWFALLAMVPAAGWGNAERCSFDPSCICVWLTWWDGGRMEARCESSANSYNGYRYLNGAPVLDGENGSYGGGPSVHSPYPLVGGPLSTNALAQVEAARSSLLTVLAKKGPGGVAGKCALIFQNNRPDASGSGFVGSLVFTLDNPQYCVDGHAFFAVNTSSHKPELRVCENNLSGYTPDDLVVNLAMEVGYALGQRQSPFPAPSWAMLWDLYQSCSPFAQQ